VISSLAKTTPLREGAPAGSDQTAFFSIVSPSMPHCAIYAKNRLTPTVFVLFFLQSGFLLQTGL